MFSESRIPKRGIAMRQKTTHPKTGAGSCGAPSVRADRETQTRKKDKKRRPIATGEPRRAIFNQSFTAQIPAPELGERMSRPLRAACSQPWIANWTAFSCCEHTTKSCTTYVPECTREGVEEEAKRKFNFQIRESFVLVATYKSGPV